ERGSRKSRDLIETWLSHIPDAEHSELRARFRSHDESNFTSALHEITLHELLRRQKCKLEFHPNVLESSNKPDFRVRQPNGPDFFLEAQTSSEIASGPEGGTRADRIRDFLNELDLKDYLIAIDELREGKSELSRK